jgi:hypothetical protein
LAANQIFFEKTKQHYHIYHVKNIGAEGLTSSLSKQAHTTKTNEVHKKLAIVMTWADCVSFFWPAHSSNNKQFSKEKMALGLAYRAHEHDLGHRGKTAVFGVSTPRQDHWELSTGSRPHPATPNTHSSLLPPAGVRCARCWCCAWCFLKGRDLCL